MSWDRGEGTAQRRRRTPMLVAGIVLAVIAVGLLVRRGSEPEQLTVDPTPSAEERATPPPAPSPVALVDGRIEPLLLGPTGVTLHAVDQGGQLLRVDLDSGEVTEVELFAGAPDRVTMLADGQGGVVAVAGSYDPEAPSQGALHLAAVDRPPVPLGPASAALPSANPGHVWLLDRPAYAPGGSVREVAYDGTVTAQATLPPGVVVLAAVEGGLLVDAGGTLVRYDPAAGRGQAIGPGRFVAADPRWMVRQVCDPQLRCALMMGPGENPFRVRVALTQLAAEALDASPFGRVLSADATRLALFAGDGPAFIDLTNGELRRAPEGFNPAAGSFGEGLAWSPSGEWLFLASSRDVLAWNPADDRVVSIDLGRSVAAIAVS